MEARGNVKSDAIKKGPARAPARAMLRATGLTPADLEKPLVAVVHPWTDLGPCNFSLRALAEEVKAGIREAGGTPFEFGTIAISDGISMGTDGMRASLVSREVIADSIELAVSGHALDAVVALCGCDKTIPGAAMALARLDIPSVALYGGSIEPGKVAGKDVTIQDVFEAVGAHAAGKISDEKLCDVEAGACPGAGACGGQFTANTMATALTFLGLSPMGANDVPATDPAKAGVARAVGRLVMERLKDGLTPSKILTRAGLRERDRVRRRDGRLDERRPAPPRDRARGGRAARPRRLRFDLGADAALRRPQAGRPLHGARPRARGRLAPRRAAPRGSGPREEREDGLGPDALRGGAGRRRDAGAGGRPPGRRRRSSRTAGSRSCAARSRPRARS